MRTKARTRKQKSAPELVTYGDLAQVYGIAIPDTTLRRAVKCREIHREIRDGKHFYRLEDARAWWRENRPRPHCDITPVFSSKADVPDAWKISDVPLNVNLACMASSTPH